MLINFQKSKDITIIFVSHGLGQVESFCTRAIYINNHHLQYDGSPKTAVEKYMFDSKNNE